MSLPEISHLQFKVLASLLDSELPGRKLRDAITQEGLTQTRASFYQLMARLEDAGFVTGRYEQRTIGDVTVTERVYELTVPGKRVVDSSVEFYRQAFRPQLGWEG